MGLDLIAELEALVAALDAEKVDYALCGGLALAVHGYPRATKDIDLLVRAESSERIMRIASRLGFDLAASAMTFGAGTKNERIVRRVTKADVESKELLTLDLIEAGELFEDVFRSRLKVEWSGRILTVVSREGLSTMKRVAGRPQDVADLAKLEGRADEEA
jgi:hypothetical protein